MQEVDENKEVVRRLAAIATLVVIAIAILFVSRNLLASMIYRKVLFKNKPLLAGERVKYYEDVLSYLSQASSFSPGNEDYYLAKADILLDIISQGLQKRFPTSLADIEKCYRKAIELNPLNFYSHLHLGLLYVRQNKDSAEQALLTAIQLCPQCYLLYAELSNYYFSKGEEAKGFFSILQVVSRAKDEYLFSCMETADLVGRKNASNLKKVVINGFSGSYTIDVAASVFDFKKEGFPHIQLPVKIKVYTKEAVVAPTLYRRYVPYPIHFTEITADIEKNQEYSVFEANLDYYSQGVYLDDFRIEMDDDSLIVKVEILYSI